VLQALDLRERVVTSGSSLDASWQRYRELLPDAERWRWLQDRKIVEVLEQHGDNQEILRRVDHWAYFTSETARRAFVNEVATIGFRNDPENAPQSDTEFAARVFRVEGTELESIHATVMQLWSAARRYGGYYDGWETSVETSPGS
jgi:hypothetical protein